MASHSVGFILIFAVLFSVVSATFPCDFPAIFNFGDSNSDTGGQSAAYGQLPSPYGESFFGSSAGRYSDGRLIIDFIAESLDLPYLNPFLDSLRHNFTHGANFAAAGASIRRRTTTQLSPFSLDVQFLQFKDFHQRPQKPNHQELFKELLPKSEDFSRALYTMDIGHNDIGALFYMSKDNVTTNVKDLVDQFTKVVKGIYEEGGRSFWIHNIGPLGCLAPNLEGNTSTQIDAAGCSIPKNKVIKYYNRKLKKSVVQLRKNLTSAAITYVDIYSAKYNLFRQANELGFEDPLQVCCGHGGKYNYYYKNHCGYNVTYNGKQVDVGKCKDPSVRINWDGSHYTQAANKWVFDQIVDGSFSDPPIPLYMACHKQY